MWTWPFKISPWGIATIIAGVVVISSSIAAWMVDDKVEMCNAMWSSKLAEANLELKKGEIAAQAKIKVLEERLAEAEKKAEVQAVKDEHTLEKQRENEKLPADCSKCRVPNAWIWVREAAAARGNAGGSTGAQSRRVDAEKAR